MMRRLALATLLAQGLGCGLDEVPGPEDLQPICGAYGPVLILDVEADVGLRLLPRRGERMIVGELEPHPLAIGGVLGQLWSVDPCGGDAVPLETKGWVTQSGDVLYDCLEDRVVRIDPDTGRKDGELAGGLRCVGPAPGGSVFVRRQDDGALGVLAPSGELTIWTDADGNPRNCGRPSGSHEVAGRTLAILSGCGRAHLLDVVTGDDRIEPRTAAYLNLSPDGEHAVISKIVPPMFHDDFGGYDSWLVDLETSAQIHLGDGSPSTYSFQDGWLTTSSPELVVRLSDMRVFDAPESFRWLMRPWPGDRFSANDRDASGIDVPVSWHPESGDVVTYTPGLTVKYLGPRGAWLAESVVDESPLTYVTDDGETFPEILPTHNRTTFFRDGSVLYVDPTSDRTGRLLHIRPGQEPLVVDEDVNRSWPRVHPGRPVRRDDGLDDDYGASVVWGEDRDVMYQVRRNGRMQLWRVRLGVWDIEEEAH